MNLRRDDRERIAHAPAKLNLFLDVLGRQVDGFHELETLMVPLRLADTISFRPARTINKDRVADIRLSVQFAGPSASWPHVPADRENLVVRALELLRHRSGCELGADVELVKRIPVSAGLGGGSSDAAAALRLANIGWQLRWSLERLAEVAAEVGSDVPFFLSGGAAVCRGRGERVERLPAVAPVHFVIVMPPAGLATSRVYEAYDAIPDHGDRHVHRRYLLSDFRARWARGRAGCWGPLMYNALQMAAGTLSPWVGRLVQAFSELDCLGHQLSGSGSAYFGVGRHVRHARRLATILRTRQLGMVYVTSSC